MGTPFFSLDSQFRFLCANSSYLHFVQKKRVEIGTDFHVFHPQANSQRLISVLERSLELRRNHSFEDYNPQTKAWHQYHVTYLPQPVHGLAIVMIDVSNQKIDASDDSLHFALAAAQMGDWNYDAVLDDTRRSIKFNQIFGYGAAKKRWSYFDFLRSTHPEDRPLLEKNFLTALENAEGFIAEVRILWPDKSIHWISLRGRVDVNNRGRVLRMAGLVMDITAQKTAELEVQNARLAAEDANREKSYFLANMSHEIRTPLGAILGFAEALQDPTLGKPERTRYLQILVRNGMSLSNLIDDILDLSKVEAGYLEIENTNVDVFVMIEEVLSLMQVKADAKSIRLSVASNGEVPSVVVTDSIRLRQILLNVVGNAIKFTDEGGVHIQVSYESKHGAPPSLQLLVKDSGVGISKEQTQRLFIPFTQADSTTTRKYGGTGLGLALSRRLARALGGDLTLAASALGKGSSFLISIDAPAAQACVGTAFSRRTNRAKEATKSPARFASLQGLHVLLAEDSPDNQELIHRLLDIKGIQTNVVSDGLQAVDQGLRQHYDAILMDMQMPHLDGYEATRQLRQAGFQGPIIALTANAMRHDREKCLDSGCSDYLSKPIDPTELYRLISQNVEKSHSAAADLSDRSS